MKFSLLSFLLLPVLSRAQQVIHLAGDDQLPTLTVYQPQKKQSKGTAVIICPGGAYAFRSSDGEGTKPALKLTEAGITAFVLDYRLPKGNDTIPLHDTQEAIQYIRNHYKEYGIDPHKVGIMGFSAGGHLASTAGTHFRNAADRPDFMVLAYAVISMADSITHKWSRTELLGNDITPEKIKLYSNELQVTDHTPGTFLVHGMQDFAVPIANSLYFYAALLQHHIPAQLFVYANYGHAFPLYGPDVAVHWLDPCIAWIKQQKWKQE